MTQSKLKDLPKEEVVYECPGPTKDLYHFDAHVKDKEGVQYPVDLRSFIPLGSTVMNSKYVYALIMYTGCDTKMAMNQGKYQFKISSLQKDLNWWLIMNISTMFTLMIIMSQIFNRTWMTANADDKYYIFPHDERPVKTEEYTGKSIMSFFLVFNAMLPLDLVVAFTLVKAIYTAFMIADAEMIDFEASVHDKEIVGCSIKNLTTLEDLSKVNNIFCDKTGTLTKNQLIFRGMGIKEKTFDIGNDSMKDNMIKFRNELNQFLPSCDDQQEFFNFWRCICICHEVI